MRASRLRCLVAMICAAVGLLGAASTAQAATDPLFVFTPTPPFTFPVLPPPAGTLEDPCGMGVDSLGRFYVSDYHHDAIDVYDQNADYTTPPPPGKPPTGATGYISQYAAVDPLDGPCGLAFDAADRLYVNDYHRAVIRYPGATTITGATTPEETHPTGVAVDPATGSLYVDQRDHVSIFDEAGAPVELAGVPVQIGASNPQDLKDGYGIAYSSYPATLGRLYVPDAASETIEVYDSATPAAGPIEEIDGSQTPKGKFVSLRDASIAVDRLSGEIYVVDDLQPSYTESPQAIVYVFGPDGSYEGHLKFLITDGMPSGLAVDNSATATQGRVYLTSGNSAFGSIYAYGPGAATTAAIALPSAPALPSGGGSGSAQGEEATAPGAGAAAPGPQESLSPPAAVAPAPSPARAMRPAQAQRKPKAHRKAHKKHRPAHPRHSK